MRVKTSEEAKVLRARRTAKAAERRRQEDVPDDIPLVAMPIPDYARAHGLGVSTVWLWAKQGRLKTIKVCGKTLALLDQSGEPVSP